MICFERRIFGEAIRRLWPPYRREQDRRTYEAIKFLVENPRAPCIVGGVLIPDGYGDVGPLDGIIFEQPRKSLFGDEPWY